MVKGRVFRCRACPRWLYRVEGFADDGDGLLVLYRVIGGPEHERGGKVDIGEFIARVKP